MKQKQVIGRIFLGASATVLFFVIGDVVAGTPAPTCCVTHYCYDEFHNLTSKASDCTQLPCQKGSKCEDIGYCTDGNATALAHCTTLR